MSAHIESSTQNEESCQAASVVIRTLGRLAESDNPSVALRAAVALARFLTERQRLADRAEDRRARAAAQTRKNPAPPTEEPEAAAPASAAPKAGAPPAEKPKARVRPRFDEAAFERLQRLREVTGQTPPPPFRVLPLGVTVPVAPEPAR